MENFLEAKYNNEKDLYEVYQGDNIIASVAFSKFDREMMLKRSKLGKELLNIKDKNIVEIALKKDFERENKL
jgi:hypothetical protein